MNDQIWGKKGPRCPNHKVVLTKTGDPGIGICPISGARFNYDEDQAEKKKKIRMTMTGPEEVWGWEVKHLDGKDQ